MLGYVLVRQPTVILRRKSECLDTCQVPFLIKTVTPVTSVIFLRTLLFLELISSAKIISEIFLPTEMVVELINDLHL